MFCLLKILFFQATAGSTKSKPAQGVLPILARPEVGKRKQQLLKTLFGRNSNCFCSLKTFTVDKLKTEDDGSGVTSETGQPEKKPRKSRWSTNKSFVPGMPTILPSNLSDDQRQAYLRKYFYFLVRFLVLFFSVTFYCAMDYVD